MRAVLANGVTHHVREDGDPKGTAVVFANSLGTDLRLWDAILPLLPDGLRLIRYDKRGHGLSDCPDSPYTMEVLTADAEALIESLDCGPVVFVGLSIGGMIGQNLAAKRPDLIRALVLSNTAAKMGERALWQDRMAAIRAGGIACMADAILERWFAPAFRKTPESNLWRAMLTRTPSEGYLGCCAAIADTDLTETTAQLTLPVLAIAGSRDGASPPDLVAATTALIAGASFEIIEGTGHLPCVEAPVAYAKLLSTFLKDHAYD